MELEVRFDIRKARAEDADAIVEVLDHVPFLKDRYRGEAGISLVENNLEMIWLADLNGRVASVMIVQRNHDFGRLEISLIVTKPEFRRRDFAQGLIRKAKRIAADSEVELVAYAENDISRDLFIRAVSERSELKGDSRIANSLIHYSRRGKEAAGMALSDDLRTRVVEAVIERGLSRNAAAERFGVSVASAVRWVKRFETTGEIYPARTGGDRRSDRIEAHRDYLLGLIRRAPDMTLLEIQERLVANCGERFSSSVLWRFFDRCNITFKKSPRMPRSSSARTF